MTQIREIAIGLIVADDGRVLLQLRDDKPGLAGAGQWGFFGGHLEPGESATSAFLRELDEELGWRPKHFESYVSREVNSHGWHVTSHAFGAHLDIAVEALTLGEGQAMRLFAPDDLPADIVPSARPVIEEFARSDAYRRVKKRWELTTTTGLLVDARGRFLLQHRDDKPDIDNPGMWGSFGGELEPYETPDEGFLRELDEELRWRPQRYTLYGGYPLRTSHGLQLIYVFTAFVDVPESALVLGEGQGMGFFAADALPEKTVPALRQLIESFVGTGTYAELRARG
ncbi:MAG TPA: NUDIX domain-containing protein [Dehalococcoidia bacterium]